MRYIDLARTALCLVILAGCAAPAPAPSPATGALLEPPAPVTRLTQIGDHFSSARKWFGMVRDLQFDLSATGDRSPRFETLTSDLVRRSDGAGQTLRAIAPARAGGAHLIGIAGEQDVWVHATEPAVEDVPAEVVDGVIVYRHALAGGDLLYKFTPTHQDEYIYFEAPPEKLVRHVDIERGPAIAELRQTRTTVEVIDNNGAARLRVGAPYARAADGTTRRGTIRVDGDALILEIDLRGLPAPVLVDPDWTTTGTMTVGHWANSAWLLPSGDAVVAGGCALAGCPSSFARPVCGTVLADTEIWDHGTGTWRAGPPLSAARFDFAQVDLGLGNALLMGGCSSSQCGDVTDVAERYDAASATFTTLPPLASPRGHVTGVLLSGGDALAIGGCDASGCTTTVDFYQSSDQTMLAGPPLAHARGFATATALPDGRVLVAGGCADPACATMVADVEIYDPSAGAFAAAGTLDTPRAGHTATLLADGKVILAGGCADAECMRTLATTEIWDPATGVVAAGPSMPGPRHNHTASLLPTGEVMFAGGAAGPTTSLPSAVVYVPSQARFIELEHMVLDRAYHTAVALPSNDVLVAGGCNPTTCMPWAEVFSPTRLPELESDGGVPDAGVDAGPADAGPPPAAPEPPSPHPAALRTGMSSCADDERQDLSCRRDAHPLQDGDFAPNDVSFEAVGSELVSASTGLSWVATEDETEYTQADAVAHCAAFSTADAAAGSYRLPTVVELATLIDSGQFDPAIDPLFVGAASDSYWSATPVISGSTQGWTVRFDAGEVVPALATHALRARCVRGALAGSGLAQGGSLVASGGTLVDEQSGLEWQAHPSTTRMTWSQGLQYCARLEVDSKSGFHVPSANELRGLLDYGAPTPVRTSPVFADLRGDTYWSSTPTYGIGSLAQAVSFNLGVQDGVSVDSPAYVVCVRHLPVVAPPSDKGCGCRVAGSENGRAPLALGLTLVLGLGLLWRRRR